jgi:hypothetical protein
MGRDNVEQQTPDLFSAEGFDNRSITNTRSATGWLSRKICLTQSNISRELDRLLAAAIEDAKRRGRPPASPAPGRTRTVVGLNEPEPKRIRAISGPARRQKIGPSSALTQGQINAVRAAFKAGITPARIARQFVLSHADVRGALSSGE